MNPDFWREKWKNNETAFHQAEVNSYLAGLFHHLNAPRGSHVFVPLCGKSLDMVWLLSQGYHVVGVELSKLAIDQFFSEQKVEYTLTVLENVELYRAANIAIFVGDLFHLSADLLGPVEAIYDRAALVALPQEMRSQYSSYIMQITRNAPQLLITFEYDQQLLEGPPFSVVEEEVFRLYGETYKVERMDCNELIGGLKGRGPVTECAWVLQRS